jgi:hypothetical protein
LTGYPFDVGRQTLFQLDHPGEPSDMALLAGELGAEPVAADLDGGVEVGPAGVQTEEVGVGALSALPGGEEVMAAGGADTFELVGDDRGSDAVLANQNADVHEPAPHRVGHGLSQIQVIDRVRGKRAQIQDTVVFLREPL